MRSGLLCIGLVTLGLLGLADTALAKECMTADCHAGFGKGKVVHAPVIERDCSACHEATGVSHPGKDSFRLTAEGPALCLQCHEDPVAGMSHPHSALEDSCTDCHDPHQADQPALLVEANSKLCLLCHDELLAAKYVHGPVASGSCQLCHGIHGSDNPSMLRLPDNEICVACHVGIRQTIEQAISGHEPVANGHCWDCHEPHSSDYRPYLAANYPRQFYAPYADDNFALCFNCHDKNAFLFERTTEATSFRNRDRNLHYFHVNRPDKGRVCKSCHGVHGADQGQLLMSRVPGFGRWDIPLRWESTETGATCYVGCHSPKSYDRLERVENP